MKVVEEGKLRILCTICGENLNLEKMSRKPSRYCFPHNGKKYEVYKYRCPACSSEMYISEKFLNDLKED